MNVGEKYMIHNQPQKESWLPNIPFTLIRNKNNLYVFYKKRGDTEVRIELTKNQLIPYGVHIVNN